MRSKSFLAAVWALATVVAVGIVWQSLGFVSTRTEDDGTTAALDGGATSPPTGVTTATTTPVGDGTAPTSPSTPTSSATGEGTSAPADAVDQPFELVGGTTVIRYSSTGVTMLYAVPADGFQVRTEPEGSGIKVEFRSANHRSRVDAWWDNGPRHSTEERDED